MSMSEATQNGLTVGFIIMIFTDLIGNTLVILTVFKTPAMRTPMNYLLVNLAVADITVAMFIAPRYIVSRLYTHPTGQAGTYVCKLLTGEVFTWVGALCSVYTLVAISIERYYAVMKPHSSKGRFTMNKFKLTAAACWIFATLWNLPLFMFSYFDEKNKFCNFAWPFKDFTKYHSVINVFIFGGIPITTMVILYSRVTYRLWFKTNDQPAGTQQGTIRARKHVTKMVLTVSIIFIISWLPNIIVYPLSSYSNTPLYGGIHIMSIVFVTFNSSINPIIYSLQSTMFRKNIWRVITCGKHAVHNSETSGGNSTRNTNASTTGTWAIRVKPRQTDDLSLVDCD